MPSIEPAWNSRKLRRSPKIRSSFDAACSRLPFQRSGVESRELQAARGDARPDRLERGNHLARHEAGLVGDLVDRAATTAGYGQAVSTTVATTGTRRRTREEPVSVRRVIARVAPDAAQRRRTGRALEAKSANELECRAGGRPCRACSPAKTISFCQTPSPLGPVSGRCRGWHDLRPSRLQTRTRSSVTIGSFELPIELRAAPRRPTLPHPTRDDHQRHGLIPRRRNGPACAAGVASPSTPRSTVAPASPARCKYTTT